jgi:hypothetical protein
MPPDAAWRPRGRRWAWYATGLAVVAVAILAVILTNGGHKKGPIVTVSRAPSPTSATPQPSPAPSVYLGPGLDSGSSSGPGDVSMTMAVQNLTGLELRIVSVNLSLSNAGEAQILSALLVPAAFSSGPPGDLPIIEPRSTGEMMVHIEPDCTHQGASYELDVHLTAGGGPIVSQRLDFPAGIYLPALLAASCQPS